MQLSLIEGAAFYVYRCDDFMYDLLTFLQFL